DIDFFQRNARFLAHHHGEHRVRSGSRILRSAAHASRSVEVQRDVRIALAASRAPRSRRNAPTENHVAALHRTNLRRALRPAELLRAPLIALLQMTRRERLVLLLVD